MTRRWVRFEMPNMALFGVVDRTEDQHVAILVAADEQKEIALARDRDGHVLVYDEATERLTHGDPTTAPELKVARHNLTKPRVTHEPEVTPQ